MTTAETAGAVLTIDLDAVRANWHLLAGKMGKGSACAAVIKADGYGLGGPKVGAALAAAGCDTLFVAQISEGVAVRATIAKASIHVLGAPIAGNESVFAEHRLTPVLNSLGDIEAWAKFCRRIGAPHPADVHVDTGMRRLGLPPDELRTLIAEPSRLDGIKVDCLMSHLACSDEPAHPLNGEQLRLFKGAVAALRPAMPEARVSFANSSGVFLGPDYHFDLGRPGVAIYGVNPTPGHPNPMRQTVRLQGKILQIRDVDTPQTVGYGATHRVTGRGRVATVAVGYADGYLRSLSNRGGCYIGDVLVPVVGRVSMDLITLDVSALPAERARAGSLVDLIGPRNTPDDVAGAAGTIGYEILTSLGQRYHRVYAGDTA